jgi:hypothetical protein
MCRPRGGALTPAPGLTAAALEERALADPITTPAPCDRQPGVKYVYVMSAASGLQKIGFASRPKARRSAVQTGTPEKVSLNFTVEVPGLDARAVERHAHWILRESRVHGEWFNVPLAEAVDAIRAAIVAVELGTALPDRRGGKRTRHYARTHPIATLHRLGELTEIQARGAMLYQYVYRRVVAGVGGPKTSSLLREGEVELDLKRWLVRLHQQLDTRLGRDARAILQAVAAEGYAVSAMALYGVAQTTLKRRLAQALDLVCEQPSLGRFDV